jgi:hypothetical protein
MIFESPTTGERGCTICGAHARHGEPLVCRPNCESANWKWLYNEGFKAGMLAAAKEKQ